MALEERRIRDLEDVRGMRNRNTADGLLTVAVETAKAQASKTWRVFVTAPTISNMNVFVEAFDHYHRLNNALKSHRRRVQGTDV